MLRFIKTLLQNNPQAIKPFPITTKYKYDKKISDAEYLKRDFEQMGADFRKVIKW